MNDPGFFSFSVIGDTSANNWSLTNLNASDINAIIISTGTGLGFTNALFDNNASPSTPNSGPGLAGVTRVSGPSQLFAFEFLPWQDPSNNGDMFEQEQISFAAGQFATNATFVWRDDTDVAVPEPGDFNFNGVVDGEDFLLWQQDPSVGPLADWEANYGAPLTATATTVPEPATGFMLMLEAMASIGLMLRWRY